MRSRITILLLGVLGLIQYAQAYVVHLVQQIEVDGAIVETIDQMVETGDGYTTSNATDRAGYIFTHWSTSTVQAFNNRDYWGRAYEQVVFSLYEPMTVTAHYVRDDLDGDADGMPDGVEVYWYGDMDETAYSDSDGDGIGFLRELELEHNPHFPDEWKRGLATQSKTPQFFKLVLRSEPEGALFSTITNNVAPGVSVATASYNPNSSVFAHWTANGVSQRDMFGRTLDKLIFAMPTNDVELVAVAVEGEEARYAVYWYGSKANGWESDTDGDGMTLREEVFLGQSPIFADEYVSGIKVASRAPQFFKLILRSEPEGALFATESRNVAPGVEVTTAAYNPANSQFAHWTANGVSQRDMFGRALDKLIFAMPTNDVELVAVAVEGEETRQAVYWYGSEANGWESDTDGDGMTLREEVLLGQSPIFADEYVAGLRFASRAPKFFTLILRSEPEGALFATETRNIAPEVEVATAAYNPNGSAFAHWTANGLSQRDIFGRALDKLIFAMPTNNVELVAVTANDDESRQSLYWHGSDTLGWDSDVDGDGMTLREEVLRETNPIFIDEYHTPGVMYALSEELEVDLQPFEQMRGTIVDGEYSELFTSPLAGNEEKSRDFGDNASPLAVDVNGDGLFDVVVVSRGGVTVLLNKGATANPDFSEAGLGSNWDNFKRLIAGMVKPIICGDGAIIYVSDDGGAIYKFTIDDGTVVETGLTGIPALLNGKLIALTAEGSFVCADAGEKFVLDTPVIEGISVSTADLDADGRMDILVADKVGHVWLYRNISTPTEIRTGTNSFKLLHKVWAGTGVGFGEGMSISLVDWEDDGDYDVVIGTADGKLMLLRDPKTGRPTNVRATAGATSVLLEWDPNSQPRIRGYNVYRAPDAESYSRIVNQTPLPRYRDVPNILQDYWYRITGVSRFYIAGNSTPTVHESMPTDAVYVQFRPNVWLNDTSSFTETNVEVVVSMNNSMGISAEGLSMTFTYDPAVLESVEMKASGLTADMTLTSSGGNGTWTMRATGGEIKTGSGIFMKLVFYVKGVHDVTKTVVTLNAATVKALDGHEVTLELPKSATIEIADSHPLVPAVVVVDVADAAVESETEFVLPVTVTSSETLTNFIADVGYDEARLRFDGWRGTIGGNDLALKFYAKDPNSTITNFATTVSVTNIVAIDCNGFSVTADDAMGTVLIKNAHPIVPAVVSVSTEDKKVDTLTEFTLPVMITSNEELKGGAFTVTYDPAVLEWRGESSALVGAGKLTLSATEDFALKFYAKDQHDITQTAVTITDATVVDIHDFTVKPSVPVVATVLIRDSKPLIPAGVILNLADAHIETCRDFSVPITVTTTKELKNLSVKVGFDTTIFEFKGCVGGTWNNGIITAQGSGPRTIILTFHAKDQHTVTRSKMTLSSPSARCIDDLVATVTTTDGTMYITDSNVPVPVSMTVATWHVKTKSGEAFKLPIGATTTGGLKELVVTVEWDGTYLTYVGAPSASSATKIATNKYRFAFPCAGEYNLFNLDFKAAEISGLQQNAIARLTAASGTGENNLAATVTTKLPVESTVMIVREIGKYSSGDVDGDGRYTDNDLLILNGYVVYLTMQKYGANFANNYASQYQSQYHVNVKLTGKAAQAADVNVDGKVDASDISMLQMLIREAEGAGL